MNLSHEDIKKALAWADMCSHEGNATEGALCILAAAYRKAINVIGEVKETARNLLKKDWGMP